jgi:tape measure domain-containing protein
MAQKVSSLAIDINVTGAPQASAALDGVEKKGMGAAESLGAMAKQGLAAGAALTAVVTASKRMLEAAETYNRIENRLRLVTDTSAQAAVVQDRLFQLAQATGTKLEDVATQYSQIALAAKDLGASQSDIIRVVESVSKTLQISGSSAAAAAGSSTQFVQALASGKLQAEELNSILGGNSALAREIAYGLGLGKGQDQIGALAALRAAVKEGRVLGSDVLGAVLARTTQIDEKFGKLGDSMERSGTRLENSFNRALDSIDNKIGASRALSSLFDTVSGVLDNGIGRSAGALISGGLPGLAVSMATGPGSATPSRPLVNRAGQLSPIRVTADRPKPRTGRTGTGNARSTVDARPSRMAATGMNGLRSTLGTSPIAAPDLGEAIAAQSAAFMEAIQPLIQLSQSVGTTLVDSLANGITAAVQSGSLSDGFKEMGRTLLGGLGAAVRDFGIQSLGIAKLMQALQSAFAKFSPGTAIVASLGLIAAGSAMVGLAGRGARASFGTTNSGINRGAASSSTITERGSLTLPSSLYGGGAPVSGLSGSVAASGNMVTVNATVIGPNDPTAQRQIAELIKRSAARGAV